MASHKSGSTLAADNQKLKVEQCHPCVRIREIPSEILLGNARGFAICWVLDTVGVLPPPTVLVSCIRYLLTIGGVVGVKNRLVLDVNKGWQRMGDYYFSYL